MSALTTLTQDGGWTVNALSGGEIKLSGLTSLASTQGIYITDTGNSTIVDGDLTSLSGVSVTTDGNDPGLVSSWTSFTDGSLEVNDSSEVTGVLLSLPIGLTDVDGSSLYAQGGGSLRARGHNVRL